MKRMLYAAVSGIIILIFFLYPQVVSASAKEGLLLWFQVVLPALLPFLILSSVILGLGIDGSISRLVSPVLTRVFGISKAGCYPVVIGMLSGYPLGAATVAEMVRREKISLEEAQYILHFCNNASPMFLLEFIGVNCLGLRQPLLVLGIIYLAAWTNALIERLLRRRSFQGEMPPMWLMQQKVSLIELLDDSILRGFTVLAKVGGYIILFSILAGVLEQALPLPVSVRAVITGLLEITSGADQMVHMAIPEQHRMILLLGCSAFGGCSSVAQSASVLADTGLSIRKYICAKSRQAVLAAGYTMLLISLFGMDVLY